MDKEWEGNRERWKALRAVCLAIFGRNNLLSTDFADIRVDIVKREMVQSKEGYRFQFTLSTDAIGKVMTEEISHAIDVLYAEDE